MPFDLPAAVAEKTRRKTVRFKTKSPPPAIERSLYSIYFRVVRAWAEQARDRIVPAYRTLLALDAAQNGYTVKDDAPTLEAQMAASEGTTGGLVASLTPDLRDWTLTAEQTHRRQFLNALSDASNLDLSSVLTSSEVADTLGAVLARNVSLVRSVSDDIRKSIADAVYSTWQARGSVKELAAKIDTATALGKTRSLLIARDQTTKLAAALDQERQQELGFEQFIWRHSGKLHYRPYHKARDGKVYDWKDNDLHGDYPGFAINCGCKAEAFADLDALKARQKASVRRALAADLPIENEPPRLPTYAPSPARFDPTEDLGEAGFFEPPPAPPTAPARRVGYDTPFPEGDRFDRVPAMVQMIEDMGIRFVNSGESQAVNYYTGSGYTTINRNLRRGQSLIETVLKRAEELDALIDAAPGITTDAIVWRGVQTSPKEWVAGMVVADPGFMSTSMEPSIARNFASANRALYRIRLKAGTKAIAVGRTYTSTVATAMRDEAEIILGRETDLRVVAITDLAAKDGSNPFTIYDLETL